MTANGTAQATLTALLQDAQGNPVPGGVGDAVEQRREQTRWPPPPVPRGPSGTYTTTMTSMLAQSKTITAAFNATSVTGTASFVAGPAASSASTLTATPGSVQANNTQHDGRCLPR